MLVVRDADVHQDALEEKVDSREVETASDDGDDPAKRRSVSCLRCNVVM